MFRRVYGIFLATILVALLPFGLFIVVAGIHEHSLTQPIAGGITTRGEVVAVSTNTKSAIPTVEFTTANGTRESFTAPETLDRPKVGTQVTVSYLPSNPNDAHDLSDGSSWLVAIILGLWAPTEYWATCAG